MVVLNRFPKLRLKRPLADALLELLEITKNLVINDHNQPNFIAKLDQDNDKLFTRLSVVVLSKKLKLNNILN